MKLGGIELEGLLGGWDIINQPANSLPQDLATALGVVNSGLLGATYQPLWYVGKQLVNGFNHMLLAREVRSTKDQKTLIVGLVINIPAGDFTGEHASVVKIIEETELPAEVQDAYDKTVTQLIGANYKPIMYIGKQIVHGTNYYVLCSMTPIYPGATPKAVVVGINVAEDKYTIASIEGIDSMNALGYAFTW